MNYADELNEKLREVCCIGDNELVSNLLRSGADVNSQNKINGWTCLHWAAKRGHGSIVSTLLKSGADKTVTNFKSETAYDLSSADEIQKLLVDINIVAGDDVKEGGSLFKPVENKETQFVPNYLAHPVFMYADKDSNSFPSRNDELHAKSAFPVSNAELVLKVRNASSDEKDFVEIELPEDDLTFQKLISVACEELDINRNAIRKIRKLPNTIIRKDKDVKRMQNFQEIEFVLN